ncbi:MAG TPA: hypothetical protein PL181_17325 [bacterium]|nr:hypothetical protein [bacterium]
MAISSECRVDLSGWEAKSTRIKHALSEALKEAIEYGMDELSRKVTQNLGGMRHKAGTRSPYPGKIPVTMISGNLHQAVRARRLDFARGVVYIDKNKAPYAVYVHYGTHKMRPRRFMSDAVAERREAIINRQRYLIKLKIRKAGGNPSEILGL